MDSLKVRREDSIWVTSRKGTKEIMEMCSGEQILLLPFKPELFLSEYRYKGRILKIYDSDCF